MVRRPAGAAGAALLRAGSAAGLLPPYARKSATKVATSGRGARTGRPTAPGGGATMAPMR
ncbi:hypothetical protein D3C78_1539600 [compost metagenome]